MVALRKLRPNLYQLGRPKEVEAVLVVLLQPCSDRKDVRVEYYVLRVGADHRREKVVRPLADGYLVLRGGGLRVVRLG